MSKHDGSWLLVVIVAVCIMPWLTRVATAQKTDAASPADVPSAAYEHAQVLVALPDGRHLNLFCMGTGAPVVVLEAGGGDDSWTFRRIQKRLSTVTRVCSYDRAGMGFSDPSDAPNTAAHTVNDLHSLITQAAIPRPFVLVGHSSGGLYASLYAARFPNDVAGMVMIDPDGLGLDSAAEKVLGQPWLNRWRASDVADLNQARRCLLLANEGALLRNPAGYPACMDDPPKPDAVLHRLFNAQLARPSEQEALLTERVDIYPGASGSMSNADLTLQGAQFDFGDKPLVVLSSISGPDDLPAAQLLKVTKAILAIQAELAARSTQGKQVVVDSKTEYIQTLHPDVVVRAVTEVIEKVREQAASRGTGPAPSLMQRGDFFAANCYRSALPPH